MRNSIRGVAAGAFVLITAAGCGQGTGPATTATALSQTVGTAVERVPASSAQSIPAESTAAQDGQAQVSPAPPATAPAQQWVMPDLVGSNLQDAQDRMQQLTGNPVFITRSHDVTGENRNQVVDSNWKVCSQNVAPGGRVTPQSTVDFGAVKLEERCP